MVENPLNDENARQAGGTRSRLVRLIPLVILLAGLGAFFTLGLQDYVSFELLRENRLQLIAFVEEAGWVAGLGFMVIYAVVVAFSLPAGVLLTITAGFLFGSVVGTFLVVVGATTGASALFLAARTALGDMLKSKLGPAFDKIRDGFNEDAFSYMMFLRLVPAFPFFIVNLAPAFLGIRFRTYFITTLVGIVPGTFVFASIGNGLGAVFEAGDVPDLSIVTSPAILVPLTGLGVLALIPIVVRRFRSVKKDK